MLCEFSNATNDEISSASLITNSMNYLNLLQLNNITNINSRTLDLIFTQDENCIIKSADCSIVPIDIHHPALDVLFTANEKFTNLSSHDIKYNFHDADYVSINNEILSINWLPYFEQNSLELSLSFSYDKIYEIIAKYVPKKIIVSDQYPPWYSRELKMHLKDKAEAHYNYKSTGDDKYYKVFSDIRRVCKRKANDDFNSYIENIENRLDYDIKSFWKYTNSARGTNCLPNVMNYENTYAENGTEIVNCFAKFFESVYKNENDNIGEIDDCNVYEDVNSQINIPHMEITQRDIFSFIGKLDSNMGPGPDGIPPLFLKNCKTNLTPILQHLFSRSLTEGLFPATWKRSFITPIYKSGNRSDVKNYRPISKLSTIPKLFEAIITDKLSVSLQSILNDEQHGFRRKRSTVTNLLTFQHFTLEKLESNSQVDTIYTDFSKAFDTINHKLLLKKLYQIGIHGSFLNWIKDYLLHRIQNVQYKSFVSRDIMVSSGVPQGSHLGPLLFIIFVNDLKLKLSDCSFLMYADDLKLYSEISEIDDCVNLQRNIDLLTLWCNENKLDLNIKKCKVMTFSRLRNNIKFTYSISGQTLDLVETMKDLGVHFDTKLKFIHHTDRIISKANRMLGFIKRMTSDFQNPKSFRTLYLTLDRPILMYASPVWSPIYENNIKKLEKVQHKFLNFVAWKLQLPSPRLSHNYTQVATIVNVSSLKSHRNYTDMKFLYDLVNNRIDSTYLLGKLLWKVPSLRLRNFEHIDFKTPLAKTNQFCFAPLWKMSKLANELNIDMYGDKKCIRHMKNVLLNDF